MRNAFAKTMEDLGSRMDKLVLLSGDIGNRLFDNYKSSYPDRFYNCGVAEANMIGLASGLAMTGFRPVVYTITPFTTTRVMEQIRIDICYHELPVVIVGAGSGLSYASLGPTHHSCEDIAILRTLPGISILAPGDPLEVRASVKAALKIDGPVYIRIGKKGEPFVHTDEPDLSIGDSLTIRKGSDVCLLSVGVLLPMAMKVAEKLSLVGVSVCVVSVISIKPLNTTLLDDVFSTFTLVATMEEHGLVGGYGSAVAEWLVDNKVSLPRLVRFGTKDAFINETSSTDYARELMGLTVENISSVIKESLKAG